MNPTLEVLYADHEDHPRTGPEGQPSPKRRFEEGPDAEKLADLTLRGREGKLRGEVDCGGRSISLYFVHVNRAKSSRGGQWFFQGITGRLR